MISAGSSDRRVAALLAQHPAVEASVVTGSPGIVFGISRPRHVEVAGRGPFGLIELMDNNPLVCADVASVPTAAQTLALIALGPLFVSRLLMEPPTLTVDIECDEHEIQRGLATESPLSNTTLNIEAPVHPTVRRARAMGVVRNPRELDEFDDLYEERYGRSFFVRRAESDGEFSLEAVANRPWAVYRLAVSPGDESSLVTVSVLADLNGKLGAPQLVHMMNVMDGQEESLGIPDLLPLRV